MTRLVLLLATPALALTTNVAARQDAVPQLPRASVFRSAASMVALTVTVTDGKKPVSGLIREDFEVYEDGVQQQLKFFEARAVPMDVILLLDTSSSMRDKMDVVHSAARGFMRTLRAGDRGAIVTFADSVTVVQTLTSDLPLLEAAIKSTSAKGSTSLHNAIYVALKQFARTADDSAEVRRQAIAVLSDGQDTASVVSFDDVMGLARKTGVNVYTIGLQSEYAALREQSGRRYFSESEYAMKSLATETGAQAFFPLTVRELKGIYDTIWSELSAQYSIGYAPSNSRNDGRYRRIVVRVPSNPQFRPRARSGYTAEAPKATPSLTPTQR